MWLPVTLTISRVVPVTWFIAACHHDATFLFVEGWTFSTDVCLCTVCSRTCTTSSTSQPPTASPSPTSDFGIVNKFKRYLPLTNPFNVIAGKRRKFVDQDDRACTAVEKIEMSLGLDAVDSYAEMVALRITKSMWKQTWLYDFDLTFLSPPLHIVTHDVFWLLRIFLGSRSSRRREILFIIEVTIIEVTTSRNINYSHRKDPRLTTHLQLMF